MHIQFRSTRGQVVGERDVDDSDTPIRKEVQDAYAKQFHHVDAVFATVTRRNWQAEYVIDFRGRWVRLGRTD